MYNNNKQRHGIEREERVMSWGRRRRNVESNHSQSQECESNNMERRRCTFGGSMRI